MSCLFLLCCMLWLKLTLFVMLQASLRSEARYTFQVWYTLVKGSILIFICLYTLWVAAVDYKSSPKNRNPRLCNFSRDCIFKIANGHLCRSRYPGNTGSLYAHHTLTVRSHRRRRERQNSLWPPCQRRSRKIRWRSDDRTLGLVFKGAEKETSMLILCRLITSRV